MHIEFRHYIRKNMTTLKKVFSDCNILRNINNLTVFSIHFMFDAKMDFSHLFVKKILLNKKQHFQFSSYLKIKMDIIFWKM